MKPLEALDVAEARGLAGVVFDLDDTLLDQGALGEAAYASLFRLRESGLRLVGCTGRPAGWADVLARQWPVDAIVAENGAIAFVVASPARNANARRIALIDACTPEERRSRRARLVTLAERMLGEIPGTALSDDNDARRTDVTLDIGEHHVVDQATVRAIATHARSHGVRTLVSSIHLHLSLDTDDKATGTLRILVGHFGEDATGACRRYAFIGDSANDAAAFAAFHVSFGVANVRRHLPGLSVPPRYVASAPMGAGFTEVAACICALRGPAQR
jgi:HAD superfamily hydrolase (TIGR01484 family)